MPEARPRSQVLSVAAAVLALHATVCWLLFEHNRGLRVPMPTESLQIVLFPPLASPRLRQDERAARAPSTQRPMEGASAGLAPRTVPAAPRTDGVTHPPAVRGESAPPIDWEAELARAGEKAADEAARPAPRRFGFPEARSKPAPPPEFGWDYAATHRVQPMETGGILVNLTDNCVLAFAPLPFVLCVPGHRPANGDLFRHMSRLGGETAQAR
jgi:hypothetical protein